MDFKYCLKQGSVKKVPVNTIRAKSLVKSSKQAIETAIEITIKENTLKTIFRELYEGLREYVEALGFIKGYKFLNHESMTYFLREILKEESISNKFDRYRKLRNGINYYGDDIEIKTVKESINEIPLIIKELEKYSNIK